jgi:hypothetical protein
MPPVPLHSSSPISPTAGLAVAGVTSKTLSQECPSSRIGNRQGLVGAPETTTTVPPHPNSHTAQPGASAGPTPTSTATSSTSAYMATPTVSLPASNTFTSPPPPQPGAVPSPYPPAPAQLDKYRPSIPPPPKAGEVPKPAAYYAPQYEALPAPTTTTYASPAPPPPLPYHQQKPNISTPARAQPPASVTSTSHDLSHPPGYLQDARASFEERPIEPYRPFANRSSHSPETQLPLEEGKGMLSDVLSWAKIIGGKVIEGEEGLWKRINNRR